MNYSTRLILLGAVAAANLAAQVMGGTPTTGSGGQTSVQAIPNLGSGGGAMGANSARPVYISGKVAIEDGTIERLRCRAAYRVDGAGARLQQTLKCASDSYTFELSSDVVSNGPQISGTWSESSRGISGTLQGRSNGGRISAVVDAVGFSANLALVTRGNRQSVSIVSQGSIRNVSITMSRS